MLSRANRLSKQKDFDKIFGRGKQYQDDKLIIRLLVNKQSFSRFSIIISAKVAKKAVIRNRLRRQIKEILRQNFDKIKPGLDIVLIAKKELIGLDYNELKKIIGELFKKANIYV